MKCLDIVLETLAMEDHALVLKHLTSQDSLGRTRVLCQHAATLLLGMTRVENLLCSAGDVRLHRNRFKLDTSIVSFLAALCFCRPQSSTTAKVVVFWQFIAQENCRALQFFLSNRLSSVAHLHAEADLRAFAWLALQRDPSAKTLRKLFSSRKADTDALGLEPSQSRLVKSGEELFEDVRLDSGARVDDLSNEVAPAIGFPLQLFFI